MSSVASSVQLRVTGTMPSFLVGVDLLLFVLVLDLNCFSGKTDGIYVCGAVQTVKIG